MANDYSWQLINKLRTDIKLLRSTLQDVEWVYECDDAAHGICPWCGSDIIEGHKLDCQRQAVLGSIGEIK